MKTLKVEAVYPMAFETFPMWPSSFASPTACTPTGLQRLVAGIVALGRRVRHYRMSRYSERSLEVFTACWMARRW
jgi:hypothetical protein